MSLFRLAPAVAACALVAACSSWMGESEAPPLPGKRISVLTHERALAPDGALAGKEIALPKPAPNDAWPQAGGMSHHAMHHMVAAEAPRQVWSTSIGTGSTGRVRLLAQPVVAEGKVFTMDAEATVSALDARTGRTLWQVDLSRDDEGMGGGLAYADGRLFASTGFAEVIALDAKTGAVAWRRPVSAPMRGAPTVRGGRVFVITVENQTHALAADDGRPLWNHAGLAETASLMGGASPAVDGDVVISPYTSGELIALRVENGSELWAESLNTLRRTDAVATLTDIRGLPVIDRGRVYAISNSDLFAAIDLRTGRRMWDREVGGIQTPWVAGDVLFTVTTAPELAAVDARTGQVYWVTPLQGWEDEEDQTGRVVWSGPVLVSDRLIVTSSHGWALAVSPYTGKVLGREELPEGVSIPPVVADGTLYFLTDDAELVAYR